MEKDFDLVVYEGLLAAEVAFRDALSKELYDSAYCDIRFTAWVKDATLTERLKRIEIEDECKEEA